jgi:hypothetical protein
MKTLLALSFLMTLASYAHAAPRKSQIVGALVMRCTEVEEDGSSTMVYLAGAGRNYFEIAEESTKKFETENGKLSVSYRPLPKLGRFNVYVAFEDLDGKKTKAFLNVSNGSEAITDSAGCSDKSDIGQVILKISVSNPVDTAEE